MAEKHPSVIEWKNPPVSGFGRVRINWKRVLHELNQNPGQWALIGQYTHSNTMAASWAQTLRKRHGDEGYEFYSATVPNDGGSELFGRRTGGVAEYPKAA